MKEIELLQYIADLAGQLKALSERSRRPLLMYLLSMVVAEASRKENSRK